MKTLPDFNFRGKVLYMGSHRFECFLQSTKRVVILNMVHFKGFNGENMTVLETTDLNELNTELEKFKGLMMIWVMEGNTQLIADNILYTIEEGNMAFLTDYSSYSFQSISLVRLLKFNKPFYCIIDKDTEVGCKGLLFLRGSGATLINPAAEWNTKLKLLWKVILSEMDSPDNLQLEMLQMLVKRLLIICTRIYKEQSFTNLPEVSVNIIREFNYLVSQHFRNQHSVSFYAGLLNKSPKTLSNIFALARQPSPKSHIDRIYHEAIRLLKYSELGIKEIAYNLGFEDLATFSRFFKLMSGSSPSEYKKTGQFLAVQ